MKRLNSSIPRSVLREAIFQSQGGLCFWCRKKMKLPRKNDIKLAPHAATLEHLLPSDSSPGNIVIACHACNNKRGNAMIDPVSGDKFSIVDGKVRRISEIRKTISKNKKAHIPWVLLGLVKKNPNKKHFAMLIGAKRS